MSWRCALADTVSGLVDGPIDLPSFSWSVTVSDASLSTTRDKGTGEGEASSLTVPWAGVPGETPEARASALSSMRRAVALFWHTATDGDGWGTPVVVGAIGPRTDTWLDTSFSLVSYMELLSSRFVVRPERFGAAAMGARQPKVGGGLRGPDGTDKKARYAHVKWSAVQSPTASQMSEEPGTYVGTYADGSAGDSGDPKRYTWTRADSLEAGKGIPARGSGAALYLHVAYATSPDGRSAFSTTTSDGRGYMGTCVDENEQDPTDPATYKWSRVGVQSVPEGGATTDAIRLSGLSRRALLSEAGRLVTESREGGRLPVDWGYRGERGAHSAEWRGFDVGNLAWAGIAKGMADADGGPDVQLRPYMADGSHFRLAFLAGSDSVPELASALEHRLSLFPGGGQLQNASVAHLGPVGRVWATGAGSEVRQLCHRADDLTLQRLPDPWPLVEEHVGDTDADSLGALRSMAAGWLAARSRPLMQLSGEVDAADPALPLGTYWPGDRFLVDVGGWPTLPDGRYPMRLMEMSGDEGSTVKLKFDVMPDPMW